MKKILTIIFFLLMITGVDAATRYVSPSGSGSTCSTGTPCSVSTGISQLVAGDTLYFKNGTYNTVLTASGLTHIVRPNKSGTSGSWITIKAENKWGAIIDCNTSADYGILGGLTGLSYVRIEDFEIKRCNNTGMYFNLSEHDIIIKGNKIHDNARMEIANSGGHNGIYMGNSLYNFTIDSNLIYTNGRLNPQTTPSATQASCTEAGANNCYNHDHGIYARGHDNTITNNIFYDHKSGWPIQLTGSTGTSDGPRWYIVNNTFADANTQRDGHVDIWTASGGHAVTYLYLQNNISYNPYQNFLAGSSSGSSTWYVRNNLVYPGNLASGQTMTISGNLTGSSYNPQFVNAAARDYTLQVTSPAINAGLATYAPSTDFYGYARPVGTADDIGAIEFPGTSGCSTDTTPPSQPSGLTATTASDTSINVSWSASTDNCSVVRYDVEQCAGAACTNFAAIQSTITSTSVVLSGLTPATIYRYRVVAFDSASPANYSTYSAIASATTTYIPPAVINFPINKPTSALDLADTDCSDYIVAGAEDFSIGASAHLYLLSDEIAIYGCAKLLDTDLRATLSDDGILETEDSLALMFDPDGAGSVPAYKFVFSPKGNLRDENEGSATWDVTRIRQVTSLNGSLNDAAADTSWTVKFKIAWADFGITKPTTGATWKMDARFNNRGTDSLSSYDLFNSDGGGFNNVSGFGTIEFINIPQTIKLMTP